VTLWWQGALEDYFNLGQEWSYNSIISQSNIASSSGQIRYSPNIPLHVVAWKIWKFKQMYYLWTEFDLKALLKVI
jgi:hypothetical protein